MERAAALPAGRAELKYLPAKAATTRGDLTAAKSLALGAVQRDPLFAGPHYLLATVYRKLDDAATAERELNLFREMENTRRQRENSELEKHFIHNPENEAQANEFAFTS